LLDTTFMTTSAVTVTGLAVVPVSTTFTFLGQVVILLLAQMGSRVHGDGRLALRLAGRHVSLVDRLALTSSIGLKDPRSVLQIVTRAILFILAIEGLGAVLLYLHWTARGIVLPSDAWFFAIFHSVMAFCNAGFDLFTGNAAYGGGIPVDPVTLVIMGVLIVVGGLGIPVLADLLTRRRGPRLHLQRDSPWSSLGLVLLGWAGLLLVEFRLGGVLSGESFVNRVVEAWFQSVAARTAGFASLSSFSSLHSPSLAPPWRIDVHRQRTCLDGRWDHH
jgi:trk system potassium uptake protein TrkH